MHRVRSDRGHDCRLWALGLAARGGRRRPRQGLPLRALLRRRRRSTGSSLARPRAGRVVIVRAGADGLADHSPEGVSIRSRVHEYGGGAMCLVPGRSPGAFAYVDQTDQRVWFCDGPAPRLGPPRREPSDRGTTRRRGAQPRRARAPRRTGTGSWRSGRSTARARAARSGASSPCRPGAPSRARPRCSRDTTSSGPRVSIRPATAWPSSSGITPTCRGTPRRSWSCPSPGRRRGARRPTRCEAAGAPWRVAGGPEESVGQPAWRPRRIVAVRVGPARAGGSPTCTRGWPDAEAEATAAHRQRRPSSTGRTGSSGRRRWRTSPTARSWPA